MRRQPIDLLTANGRPFLYFPLRHHFEQTFHVAHRLDRYGAGRRLNYETDGPAEIAAAIAENIGRETSYRVSGDSGELTVHLEQHLAAPTERLFAARGDLVQGHLIVPRRLTELRRALQVADDLGDARTGARRDIRRDALTNEPIASVAAAAKCRGFRDALLRRGRDARRDPSTRPKETDDGRHNSPKGNRRDRRGGDAARRSRRRPRPAHDRRGR